MDVNITHIDTASILLDINGYKILTDPTLDPAGKLYYHGSGSFSRKTHDPAITIDQLRTLTRPRLQRGCGGGAFVTHECHWRES